MAEDPIHFLPREEQLALLKLLDLGDREIEAGRSQSARAVIEKLRAKRKPAEFGEQHFKRQPKR